MSREEFRPLILLCAASLLLGCAREAGIKLIPEVYSHRQFHQSNDESTVDPQAYFPRKVFHESQVLHDSVDEWYSKHLKALREPSLWALRENQRLHVYRFLWLRTFHNPVAIRVNVRSYRAVELRWKITTGYGGYEPGTLVTDSQRLLGPRESRRFLGLIGEFWDAPSTVRMVTFAEDGTENDVFALDRADWILEGIGRGEYHIITREGAMDPVGSIGMFLLKMSGIDTDPLY